MNHEGVFEGSQNKKEGQEVLNEMVPATRISTIFDNQKVLQILASAFLSEGLISGFIIEPVHSGYLHDGQQVEEQQYALRILVERNDDSKQERIKERITTEIKRYWDVPIVSEEDVMVPKELFDFIDKSEVEHKRFVGERRKKRIFMAAALTAFLGLTGTVSKQYLEKQQQKTVTVEKEKEYKRLQDLRMQIQEATMRLEQKLAAGEELTESSNDMAAHGGFEETKEPLQLIREAEESIRKILDQEKAEQ
ncbi:MAG: hypothetical protein KBD16_04000 [Candidatus Pacebacteria bacterium]|nr:hypothetical protein [Candidatus Paceibacterota bacterium]